MKFEDDSESANKVVKSMKLLRSVCSSVGLGWLMIRATLDPDLADVEPALRQEPPVCFHTIKNEQNRFNLSRSCSGAHLFFLDFVQEHETA